MEIQMQSREPDSSLLIESLSSTVDLGFDVIYTILSFLPRRDLLRVMSTCHTLNHAGVRHLLKFNVYLYNTRKLESFCAFMVTQAPFRYPFLRHLSIAGFYPMPSSESISQLVEILTHASRLQTLHLSCYDLLKSDHRLQAACSSLTSIKEFHICWNEGPVFQAQDLLYKMLKQMQSLLVKADLRFFRYNDGIGLDLATLLHSTATLEDLTVSNIAFQSELQFPRLRKLSFSTINYPPLALTARIFPNLTDLTILRDIDHLNAENDRYRQLNRSVQLAGGGWTSLDRLTGWPLDLYSLGLTCPIRCVKIFVYSHNHELVADILSDCRPSQIDIVFNDIFPSVRCLSDEVAARLTYLRCTIHLIYFDRNPIALNTFQLLLQHSPLTHFMLKLNIHTTMTDIMFVQQCGPEALASQIIASHPSIRCIAIKINDAEPLFWKVLAMESGEVVVDKAPKEDISVVMDF